MFREIMLGSAVALYAAGQASALTVTLLEDNRFIEAEAFAGEDFDSDEDFPESPFSPFVSEVSASAMEFGYNGGFETEDAFPDYGAVSFAGANQESTVSTTTISVSGAAYAEGGFGNPGVDFQADSEYFFDGSEGIFEAYAESVLDVLFSIDGSAAYDIQAFLSAGIEPDDADQVYNGEENGAFNFAEMSLFNEDTGDAVFEYEVSDDSINIVDAGVIGPGTYRFTASAYAEVFGGFFGEADLAGDADTHQPDGYGTTSRFGGIGLQLIAADQPIPEPLTTSLIGLGLGALVLQTSRRHRA